MSEPRYVRSNGLGQIFFASCLKAYDECGMNVRDAKELHAELGKAIEQAEQTPFDRWWQSLYATPGRSIEQWRSLRIGNGSRDVTRQEAEELFNSIRSAQ